MKDPIVLVRHILGAIDRIEKYVEGLSHLEFERNVLVQDGVIRNREIIGEASKGLPSDFKQKFPELPWRKIKDMRNKLTHEYFSVDLEILWNVVTQDLPELKNLMVEVFNSQHDRGAGPHERGNA